MRRVLSGLGVSIVVGLLVLAVAADDKAKDAKAKDVKAKAEKIAADKLPKKVMDAIKGRFPGAEITSAEKETEDGAVVYDIELKVKGRKHEMDIKEDGTIVEVENEIALKDVPQTVTKAVKAKFPKAAIKEVMEVNKVTGKDEKPIHYEVTIETTREVIVSLDGKSVKGEEKAPAFTTDFQIEAGELGPTGRNPYFILEPGYQLVFKHGSEELIKTVLNETKKVDGVECRVIEEKELKNGKPTEISRNYYAISKRTNSVYYFGEEVDIYEDGKVTSHEGAWLSGEKGAKFGLMMPGTPLLGARFAQEVAPKVAMDQAKIVSMSETIETPAGTFKNCVKTEETNPLKPEEVEYKYWSKGIGLVKDDKHELVKHGFIGKETPKTKK